MKKWLMAAALAAAGLAAADANAQAPYNPVATGPVTTGPVAPSPAPTYVPSTAPTYTPGTAPTYVQGSGACPPGANCAPQAAAPMPAGAPTYGGGGGGGHKWATGKIWTKGGLFSIFGGANVANMPTLPVYMAAPWYLYWPYDGHFQTVAPMAHGLYYPPPMYTGNPWMPGVYPGYTAGAPVQAFPVAPVKP
jgi:hypothetical protein